MFRIRRKLIGYCISGILICIYVMVLMHKLNGSSDEEDVPVKCYQGVEELTEFEELAVKIRSSFSTLKLSYVLCYSTLWGALKYNQPLPWQRNLDFCVLNEQLSKHDEGFISKAFKKNGLISQYNGKNGYYKVTMPKSPLRPLTEPPFARVFLFELDEVLSKYRRIGWKHRLIPPDNCNLLHCFPASLFTEPLPKITFINEQFHVPHEEEEMLKYLYPDTWWKDIEPRMCKIH